MVRADRSILRVQSRHPVAIGPEGWLMSKMPGTVPLIVFLVGVGLLALEIVFIALVNHGGVCRRRIRERRRRSVRTATRRRYVGDGAFSRTVNGDDADADDRRAAHGLVDRSGLRRVPGNHPQHLGGVRRSRTGARSRADVRPFARVAPGDDQDLGRRSAPSWQVRHASPPSESPLANTALALYSQAMNTAPTLYPGRVRTGGEVL